MREPYLLAASLLTGLAIPTSTLPKMASIPPENSRSLWQHLKQTSQLIGDQTIVPTVDISLPEFSSQALWAADVFPRGVGENTNPRVDISLAELSKQVLPAPIDPSFDPIPQEANPSLVSGNQLYHQRLAALKTGQIYTRVDDNLYSSQESGNKHQLTYEDWKGLLNLEAKALAQGQGINRLSILVGDSLSMWFPKEKLPTGKLWLNQGISGDTTSGVLKRLSAFSATRPDVIYLMVGINDLRKNNSNEIILRNHRRIIHYLRQNHPATQIIVQSILPARLKTISNDRIRYINGELALIASQEGANYLDIHSWFTDVQGNLRAELTTDGLHLSSEGYDVWKSALQQIESKVSQIAK